MKVIAETTRAKRKDIVPSVALTSDNEITFDESEIPELVAEY